MRHRKIFALFLTALLAALASGGAAGPGLAAQAEMPGEVLEELLDQAPDEAEGFQTNVRPSARVPHISGDEAPMIDADLSDTVWAKATVIQNFRQRQPNPGNAPTERTVLRVMYSDTTMFFGIYAYDSEPDRLIVRSMSRDGQLSTGDNIQIALDPGLTRRNAYVFMMGPSGGRLDSLRLNNLEELPEWDTIWAGRARRVSDGWVAEIAIPFRSISYVEGQTDWGFEFTRVIRRKAETVRWSSINPALAIQDISQAGTLTGITDVNQGLGLDVVPFVALRAKHDWSLPGEGAGISATMGGNAFYKITPGLTGTLTFNPDFSDAPLDDRQVNTTRFSLFLPETRDFFLQDAGSFEFGGRPFRRTSFDRQSNNGRPFFSRNLGLVKGQPVSLIGGGKVSGEYGGFNIGALTVHTDNTLTEPGQQLSVARVTRQVFNSQSKVGFIVTDGDPTGLTRNTLAGADFQYRDQTTFAGKTVQADAFFERSYSSKAGDDNAYGLDVTFPNEPWNGEFTFKTVGPDFTPALGFVNRRDMRLYDLLVGRIARNPTPFFRTFEVNTRHQIFTDLSGKLDSRDERIQIQVETRDDATFFIEGVDNYDRLNAPFALPRNVIIPKGNYAWNNFVFHYRSSFARALSVHSDGACCDYYNGTQYRLREDVDYRPSEYYELTLSHEGSYFRLPGGNVDVHVLSLDGIVNFTPDMQLAFQTQYDNISKGFGFLGRYRWEFRPGSEILFTLGQTALIPGSQFDAKSTTASLRVTHTLQF